MHLQRRLLCCAIASAVASVAAPAFADQANELKPVQILGDRQNTFSISGSAHVLSNEDLEEKENTDVHRMLRDVPGVYFQEEEGYGLRPNIGIRGSGRDRSSKVTLMEDGVLIAPAPYAAPAAYYFPSAGRFYGIEVLKGPDTLRYGPFTVGGAINFLSTPIPGRASGMVNVEGGEDGAQRAHAYYGATEGQFGFMLEAHQQRTMGFKDIDRSNRDSGFDKRDYVAKLRWQAPETADIQQAFELKLEHSSEVSDETYLGLTDRDFARDANRRYGMTDIDQMDNDRDAVSLRHTLVFDENTQLNSVVYRNEFNRNWYKLDRIEGQSIGAFMADANASGGLRQAQLRGADADDLVFKNNNREYVSEGVQTELNHRFQTGSVDNDLIVGARYHQDEVDRYQPTDTFDQRNGSLVYQTSTLPTGGDNRLENADAMSAWIIDHAYIGDFIVTGSLRYENVESKSKRWGDPARNNVSARTENRNEELMAGLGTTWLLNDNWSLLAGVHQGFAPAGASASKGTEAEKSVNYEAGFRYSQESFNADVIAFYSDYENTLQNCSVANSCELPGGGIQESGTVSLGESKIQGLEVGINSVLWEGDSGLRAPVRLAYTYTDGEITKTSESADSSVERGDVLPYLPEHLASLTFGLEKPAAWSALMSVSHTENMCIDNTCDRPGEPTTFKRTSDYVIADVVATYHVNSDMEVYAKVDNVFDDQEIVSRDPAGARPNKPRTGYLGMKVRF
ncbi:MAG: TonB-dependent receptor [Alcanivorax sp.]|nr:TonB-dependent receptor [Alcanivorax sp.]